MIILTSLTKIQGGAHGRDGTGALWRDFTVIEKMALMTWCWFSDFQSVDLFDGLPPAKRKKKLNSRISDLKTSAKKEEAELKALEKLTSVYTANPSLGDPNVVQQKIAPVIARVDGFNDEMYKLEVSEFRLCKLPNVCEFCEKSITRILTIAKSNFNSVCVCVATVFCEDLPSEIRWL